MILWPYFIQVLKSSAAVFCIYIWQLTRMRVHCSADKKKKILEKKKHAISRYRTCDFLTWSQLLFCHGHANILTCNSRAKSDGYIQANRKFCTKLPSVGLAQARPNYCGNTLEWYQEFIIMKYFCWWGLGYMSSLPP